VTRAACASLAALLLAGCAAAPEWQHDLLRARQDAHGERRDLVVYFALPGRDASDAMQQRLDDPLVLAALQDGGFLAVVVDGIAHEKLYRERLFDEWIGGAEGMGIAVLDADGECYAARPGPQDAEELAAFLRTCASHREQLAALRRAAAQADSDPTDVHRLGCLYLRLGCRRKCETLLITAAQSGVADASHRLARLYALDGYVTRARQWLKAAPRTPQALVTEGYVLFKERRHREAIEVFERALATGELGDDRQLAVLYLGKSLHENGREDLARPMFQRLAAEGTGSTFEAAAVHSLRHIDESQDHEH